MHPIQTITYILLVHISFGRSIFSRQDSKPLDKRWNIELLGLPTTGTRPPAPITEADVNHYIDQIAEISQYIVDYVVPGEALFIQWFGEPQFHTFVINIFRRLSKIRTFAGLVGNLQIAVNADMTPTPRKTNIGNPVSMYVNAGEGPIIKVFEEWKTLYSFLDFVLNPANSQVEYLHAFLNTRQGVLFHELLHFVTDLEFYGPVIDGYPRNGECSLPTYLGPC
ncbi:hypothetical protein HYALB_00011118 [Hymenoscyphus albidus]|uniref:Uncharacterized protein n=1 Tax=Hymenoscyphus albidus TaxID=595503 RepID=A0A9N9PUT4_9HELO|nr:hypothetical protein HYALB_00011118 [Hymenoscyphus albidus]